MSPETGLSNANVVLDRVQIAVAGPLGDVLDGHVLIQQVHQPRVSKRVDGSDARSAQDRSQPLLCVLLTKPTQEHVAVATVCRRSRLQDLHRCRSEHDRARSTASRRLVLLEDASLAWDVDFVPSQVARFDGSTAGFQDERENGPCPWIQFPEGGSDLIERTILRMTHRHRHLGHVRRSRDQTLLGTPLRHRAGVSNALARRLSRVALFEQPRGESLEMFIADI